MKTIIEMAKEAGFKIDGDSWIHAGVVLIDGRKAIDKQLERFAEIVRADEREACAKECERMMMYPNARQESAAHDNVWAAARAIRARGNT
jgi:hypothetical protein